MNFRQQIVFLKFTKQQRIGIFSLFAIIIILQLVYFFVDFNSFKENSPDKQKWLALQTEVDSLKLIKSNERQVMYPFNPNFISDYKGYKLGMSVVEIDRLLAFRKRNKFVNSAKEFQDVTKVSDSLLNVMTPFFKFPDWVNHKKDSKEYKYASNSAFAKKEKITIIDINQAVQEDLIKISGIGEAISLRILTQKEKLGGFVSMEQLKEVWGLSPEVILNLNKHFAVIKMPSLKKIDINNASLKELSQFYYFKQDLARQIVKYRSMNGDFKNIEDLIKINSFPVEKANFISLYLSF
ncbi:ComEA family DNA-binding protein [Flavobacterium aquicola]|uniref:DNA uptake protein ComE-like DNA-binding protein n=1 Tax=Flavobacterium aquicola TaxID=1682742 RepID=A0A3E0EN36_9FLAO|nr:helix-hairpin-helix domain-containing protein [Flavobacterium aquicola]REG98556.1 DNA uptake protein ComE-like DNA-binding protein [Flavobacterium aquicola]